MNTRILIEFLLGIPGVLIAIIFHQFAQALASDKLGDPTPRRNGKLSLLPTAHFDPMGFLLLLLVHFGWSKPIETDSGYYKNRKFGEIIVAVSGTVMNLFIAFLCVLFFKLCYLFNVADYMDPYIFKSLYSIFSYICSINISLGLFLLLPFPGLSGFKLATALLNSEYHPFLEFMRRYGFMLLVVLIVTNPLSYILSRLTFFIMNFFNFIIPIS